MIGARLSRDGDTAPRPVDFGEFVRRRGGHGRLVVQPRMGFSDPRRMRAGLRATRAAHATTVGTVTLDSYTRVGDLRAAARALADGVHLNGYPIVNHDYDVTRRMLDGVRDDDFPVQVRHGSAVPDDIFAALVALRLNATEGGPVSYCLPYGRTPLTDAVRNWRRCTEQFARLRDDGVEPHLETFGGCLMGQLCPPSQLVALSVLEALFFVHHGVRSVSVSYAQQTNMEQDREAVFALRRLCAELLPTDNWHVVVYAYMGVYPCTPQGADRLLERAAELTVTTGSERLIVKTTAEARRIPTVAENVAALERAGAARGELRPGADSSTYAEAAALVHAVLNLDADPGRALLAAFRYGVLDVPFCLHPDNMGRTRGYIDSDGWLRWADIGSMPLRGLAGHRFHRTLTSSGLLDDLSYIRRTFDHAPAA
ncbi:methylaspartate mutase [Paractinoplanes abujensis]|uniref:Methylaspartate mutase epsilon subunit n=1 Tax=Paractinoplanes abujensis TaxID=882441 RepID=A0A7W7G1W0_9ACTN|nr:methylaspartate mutase [Actinoplanes abujensis]MBB4693039.1 methylaspartate mutase epsilon subunit [Actinoplanes abujensis]GID24939.1 methylaspartate mutase [Actinoplanes abujensis]